MLGLKDVWVHTSLCTSLWLPAIEHLWVFMDPAFSFHNEKDRGNLSLPIFMLEIILFSLVSKKKYFSNILF